ANDTRSKVCPRRRDRHVRGSDITEDNIVDPPWDEGMGAVGAPAGRRHRMPKRDTFVVAHRPCPSGVTNGSRTCHSSAANRPTERARGRQAPGRPETRRFSSSRRSLGTEGPTLDAVAHHGETITFALLSSSLFASVADP